METQQSDRTAHSVSGVICVKAELESDLFAIRAFHQDK